MAGDQVARIEIRRGKSPYFYGLVEVAGKRHRLCLKVKVEGHPPPNLKGLGDAAFERSRQRAIAKYFEVRAQLVEKGTEERLLKSIYRLKTGTTPGEVPITDIYTEWAKCLDLEPRPRATRYLANAKAVFRRFAEFLQKRAPDVKVIAHVTPDDAKGFLASEFERGISAKTYNDNMKLMRSAFTRLARVGSVSQNPFQGIASKQQDTVHRDCFTTAEIEKIKAQAKKDEFIGPIVLTALCTAMRRGDCCGLRKSSVDLKNKMIAVRTQKTKTRVKIPIFPLLYDVLERAIAATDKNETRVFPQQEMLYQLNPDKLTDMFKGLLKSAGVKSDDDLEPTRTDGQRLRRPSRRGYHAFRTTWTTMALANNVPLAVVQAVSGITTVAVVQEHYLQLRPEHFEKLDRHLPQALKA